MIKDMVERLIDTIVVLFLAVLAIILAIFAFLFFPFKNIKIFLGQEIIRLMDAADEFLQSTYDD